MLVAMFCGKFHLFNSLLRYLSKTKLEIELVSLVIDETPLVFQVLEKLEKFLSGESILCNIMTGCHAYTWAKNKITSFFSLN